MLGRLYVGGGVPSSPVWISGGQFAVWQRTQLIVAVVPGRRAGFSIEAPTGKRFLAHSRVIPPKLCRELPDPPTGAEVEARAALPEAYGPIEVPPVALARSTAVSAAGASVRTSRFDSQSAISSLPFRFEENTTIETMTCVPGLRTPAFPL